MHKARLTTFMYLFRAIKPIFRMDTEAVTNIIDAETSHHPWLKFQVPLYKLATQKRHVELRHNDITKGKIVSENVDHGLYLGVFIYSINDQHVTN